jgi:ribonuclease VapC
LSEIVLDASALLAFLREEPGAAIVSEVLENTVYMSAVNWAEVLSKISDLEIDYNETVKTLREQGILGEALVIVPLKEEDAPKLAKLRQLTKRRGLSLGDRACLALAETMKAKVLTTDRNWQEVKLPNLKIQVIR